VRHIPEEELHAYLDQALSRSQCVEIERHLTRCPRCRMAREEIAAVRDRTTDLLARVGPPPFLSPPFEQIRQQSHLRHRRRRHLTGSLLAAGLALAVLLQVKPDRPARESAGAAISSPSVASAFATPARAATEPAPRIPAPSAAPAHQLGLPQALTRAEPPVATPPSAVTAQVTQTLGDTGPPAVATLTALTFESPSDASAPGFSDLGNAAEIEAQPVDLVPAPPGLWLTVGSEDGRIAAPAVAARIPYANRGL
jgi:anti-sigma factor RsiW